MKEWGEHVPYLVYAFTISAIIYFNAQRLLLLHSTSTTYVVGRTELAKRKIVYAQSQAVQITESPQTLWRECFERF